MKTLIKTFDKAFGVSSISSPIGSCRDNFLLNRAIGLIEKSELKNQDKDRLINIFRENMHHSSMGFDNGTGAGKKYIQLIEEYFKAEGGQNYE